MQEESPGWGEGGHPSNVFLCVQRDGGEGKEPDHCPLVTLHTGQVQGRASIPDPFDVTTMNPPPGWGGLQIERHINMTLSLRSTLHYSVLYTVQCTIQDDAYL